MTDEHTEELNRLWRAIKRDLSSSILEFAGFKDGNAFDRLMKNWDKFCDLNLDAAASIHHGIEQIEMAMARHGRPNSPSDHRLRQMSELVGLADIAREKYPDAPAETVRDLVGLAETAIADEIDKETGGSR